MPATPAVAPAAATPAAEATVSPSARGRVPSPKPTDRRNRFRPPFQVPLPHNVLYMLLALLRRHARPVYRTLPLRRLVLDFLAPLSEACNRRCASFDLLQDAVMSCRMLSKEICVVRDVGIFEDVVEQRHSFFHRYASRSCHVIVPHGLRLRVFGPGTIRGCRGTICFGLLPGSSVEYDASGILPEENDHSFGIGLQPEFRVCQRISWGNVWYNSNGFLYTKFLCPFEGQYHMNDFAPRGTLINPGYRVMMKSHWLNRRSRILNQRMADCVR